MRIPLVDCSFRCYPLWCGVSVAPRVGTAVDDEGGAGDITTRRRGEESDHPGDLFRGAEATERYRSFPPGALVLRVVVRHPLGRDRAGCNADGPDADRLHSRASPAARFSRAARAELACTI